MPLFWNSLLRRYLKLFFLSITTFVFILLLMRLQEIVRFATMTTDPKRVFLFAFLQIPYILPLSIPISSLIASFIVMQSMSRSCELTAFRAAGLSTSQVRAPILAGGAFIAILALFLTSELTPRSRLLSKELVYETTLANPLLLIQKAKHMKIQASAIDMEEVDPERGARNVVIAFRDQSNERLSLISAKKLKVRGDKLTGSQVALVTSLASQDSGQFDQMVIENESKMEMNSQTMADKLQKDKLSFQAELLPFKWMWIKGYHSLNAKKRYQAQANVELCRRLSLAFATFTFTFIGAAFGVEIGRRKKKKGLGLALLTASFFLICFSAAKSFHKSETKAALFYGLPHLMVIGFSSFYLKRTDRGLE